MGILGIARELPDSPEGSIQTGDKTKASFTRKFLVETDSHSTGPLEVLAAVGVPRPYQLYVFGAEAHLLSRVVDRSAKRLAPNSLFWEVQAKYETAENEEEEEPENPLLEPAEIGLTFENDQEVVHFRYEGESLAGGPTEGIRNSAGEMFNPLPVKDVARPVLTITRNEDIAAPVAATAVAYVNAVSNDAFWGAGAGTARMIAIDVKREFKEIDDEGTKIAYLKVTYKIMFKQEGWDLHLLDHGNYYIEDGKKFFFKSEDGHPYLGLLNKAGGKSEAPFFLDPIPIYPKLPFAALNLPNSFLG